MNTIALPYRELAIGASYEGTARTLTQTDLSLACMLSGDWHPIHADAEFCRAAGMPGPMFHGPYGILLAMGMATSLPAFADRVVGATGLAEWRYRRPLLVGHTVRVRATISGKRMTSDGVRAIVDRRFELLGPDGEIFQEGVGGTMLQLASEGEQS
ncbi:hypothetical protein CDO44_17925 [Pigmentiphaga sp. NML080357]|uniref:MaoC/PaaZ C-terminal domain-containing protein n=1 Tax=Pigmentiphaga sp. NML080357 TaxID=2008675 RepID=UPI000B422AD2|nr:MaoC/PaaZ C-terminal domain-containing protein [Pigmentiphaga sp. NML080357]OVZ57635.1 hypothetical protein CDO44_17925 [Pigmentiphaga sp. NML080357]